MLNKIKSYISYRSIVASVVMSGTVLVSQSKAMDPNDFNRSVGRLYQNLAKVTQDGLSQIAQLRADDAAARAQQNQNDQKRNQATTTIVNLITHEMAQQPMTRESRQIIIQYMSTRTKVQKLILGSLDNAADLNKLIELSKVVTDNAHKSGSDRINLVNDYLNIHGL